MVTIIFKVRFWNILQLINNDCSEQTTLTIMLYPPHGVLQRYLIVTTLYFADKESDEAHIVMKVLGLAEVFS